MKNNVIEVIKKRKSIRNFTEKEISQEDIQLILEAAMLAPSACNRRPWHFFVIENKELIMQLASVHIHTKLCAKANKLIIVCANLDLESRMSKDFYPQDCAAATQNILLQATSMNIGTCWCGIYPVKESEKKVKDILNLSDNLIAFNIIALGYTDEEFGSRGYYETEKITYF